MQLLGLDEKLLTRENIMADKRPTRLAAVALRATARAVNPLLALDAKIDYMPIFRDLTTKNLAQRRPKIIADLKALLKGKTIAKDADLSHVEGALKHLEGVEPKSADESVSEEQHNAMEAAAHGESNLGIPKSVGEEFSEADKGKSFDAVYDWLRGRGMSDDDLSELKGMMEPGGEDRHRAMDVHHYHGARDEEEDEEAKAEREKAAEDRHPKGRDAVKHHHHYANDAETEEERKKREAEDARRAAGKDKKMGKDEVDKAIKDAVDAARKSEREIRIALDEATPLVGALSKDLVFDTADDVRRHVLKLRKKDPTGVDSAGLRLAVSMLPVREGERPRPPLAVDSGMAEDAAADFHKMFAGAAHIGQG